jgi:hypothetical protein
MRPKKTIRWGKRSTRLTVHASRCDQHPANHGPILLSGFLMSRSLNDRSDIRAVRHSPDATSFLSLRNCSSMSDERHEGKPNLQVAKHSLPTHLYEVHIRSPSFSYLRRSRVSKELGQLSFRLFNGEILVRRTPREEQIELSDAHEPYRSILAFSRDHSRAARTSPPALVP